MDPAGELSAGFAHDINNPLAIILTKSQVHRCSLITQNLLKYSRRNKSQREAVNLNIFIEEVVRLMDGRAKAVGKGTGLGLSITYGTVKGVVETFRFEAPLARGLNSVFFFF